MTGYVRKDTTNNIADGNVINAADLDAEFDGVQDAFNASTGHKHDGTAGEGATINALGPTQDVTISAVLVAPKTTNTVDIGSNSLKFKDLFLAGNGSVGGTLAVTGVATLTAQPILSSLTASRAVFTDGSKGLVSNAITGTGNVVMSASPTLTGTIGGENATLSGTLGVTGVATFTAQPILSSLTASRAVFSDGSKGLVSNAITGTGNVVMSASPTLTGTIDAAALTASGNVTLSGGTANGVAYLNGSKVVTSGSALTFDGTGAVSIGSGGTGSVTAKITLSGSNANNYGAQIVGQRNGSSTWILGDTSSILGGATTGLTNYVYGDTPFIWYNGGTSAEQMRLTSTGLGIGTSSPAQTLHVKTSTAATPITLGVLSNSTTLPALSFNGAYASTTMAGTYSLSGSLYTTVPSGAAQYFSVADSIKLTLDSSGNLGLGVTPSASTIVQFEGGSNLLMVGRGNAYLSNNATFNSGFKYINTSTAGQYNISGSTHSWSTAASGTAGNAITFTQAMTLDADGDLGIGTTTPSYKLDVNSAGGGLIGRFVNGAGRGNVRLDGYDDTTLQFYRRGASVGFIQTDSSGVEFLAGTTGAYPFIFHTNNTERARITSGGNFLVGTTGNGSPGLGVANSTNISFPESTNNTSLATMFRQAGTGDLVLGSGVRYSSTSTAFANSTDFAWARSAVNVGYGAIKFFTAAEATVAVGTDTTLTERARIDSSGNLLVGTTTSSSKLTLDGTQTFRDGADSRVGTIKMASGAFQIATNSDFELTFQTNATERARIDSSGQLLIGVTSLPSAGSGGAGFRADSNGRRNLYLSTSSTSNNGLIYFSNPNGEVGSITVSGSATAYNTSSDYRLKNITGALTGYKERLMSLQPKQGTWKADGSEFRGFLAHEFAEPYSASVTGEKDAVDADNKPIMQAMQASSSEVMADLVALVKEQQAIIESLKARLDAANL